MRRLFLLCLFLLILLPVHAQDTMDGYAEAQRRIAEAKASGATELDLSGLDLTELPPELWELSKLEGLSLNDNQLKILSSEIRALTELQVLNLSNNQLIVLPIEIGSLENLKYLSVENNPLTFPGPEIVNQGSTATINNLRVGYYDTAGTPEIRAFVRMAFPLLIIFGGIGYCLLWLFFYLRRRAKGQKNWWFMFFVIP